MTLATSNRLDGRSGPTERTYAVLVGELAKIVAGEPVAKTTRAIAVVLGTPGCEIGVWADITARLQEGRPSPICTIGLDHLDEWEARRRARPTGGDDRRAAVRR